MPFGTVGRAQTREDAGSISGLVCARSYFNLLFPGLESNEVDLKNGATKGEMGKAPGSEGYRCPELGSHSGQRRPADQTLPHCTHSSLSAQLPGSSLSPSRLALPPVDMDEELIPSSPQQPFTCLIAFIAS